MTHREVLNRLDDFADGTLSTNEARQIQAHLAECPGCRQELAKLGTLLDAATALRASAVTPRRDLWPGVLERLGESGAQARQVESASARSGPESARQQGRFSWRQWFWEGIPRPWSRPLALGAGLLLVVVVLYGSLSRWPGTSGTSLRMDGLATMETEAAQARGDLQVALKQKGGSWPADTGSVFERNLRLLDEAIRDSRVALASDPRNQGLQRSLLTVYQRELDLIRWATRLIQQT